MSDDYSQRQAEYIADMLIGNVEREVADMVFSLEEPAAFLLISPEDGRAFFVKVTEVTYPAARRSTPEGE